MTADESPKDDDFPVGMRVLAVDDDPTCLKLLEGMLRLCKYHVTTSSQAIVALSLLRENKDRFDLVLSDVHMPDMDGFKLLELIGLEMDLPVIMMSVNGETSTVMKGVTHGACDYLLKPIRLEELRNIWQHVLRRRKEGSRNRKRGKENASTPVRGGESGDGVEGCNENGQYNNGKLDRKQIKQSSEEDEEEHEVDDEQSSLKKQRVVWSMELHQRFVAAVNHLGIDKAFPKRILDIMNVDKLTRENVASHLQKYRLYLKRMENQHGGMTSLGAIDPSFLRVGSIGSVFRDFHPLSMTEEFSNTRLASLQGARTVGGLNSSRDFAINAPNSPRMIQLGYMPTLKKPVDDLRKTTLTSLSDHQHGNMLQGLAMFPQLDCLQNKSSLSGFGGSSTLIGDQLSFLPSQFQPTDISSFSNTGISNRRLSSNTFLSVPDDPLMTQLVQPKEHQQGESRGKESQSSIIREQIYGDSRMSSGVPDLDICSKSLQNAAQITGYCTALPMVQFQKSDDPATSELNTNNSWRPSLLDSNVFDLSSLSTVTVTSTESVYGRRVISPHATRGDGNRTHSSQGDDDASKFSLSRSAGNGIPQNHTGFTMKKDFDIQNVPHDKSPNILWGSSICSAFQAHQLVGHSNQYSAQTNDPSLAGKDNFALAAASNDGLVKLENDLLNNTAFSGFFDVDVRNCLEDMVNNEVMRRV